jgi:hypothetical protein
MKNILALSSMCLLSMSLLAQNKPCKYIKSKTPAGEDVQVVQTPFKIGNFVIGRNEGKIMASYSLKGTYEMAADTKNMTTLKLDSITFLFEDKSSLSVKVSGYGTLPNVNNQLKPAFQNVKFALFLNADAEKKFRDHKLNGFHLSGEKDAGYGDMLNAKQKDQLMQAFTCIQ